MWGVGVGVGLGAVIMVVYGLLELPVIYVYLKIGGHWYDTDLLVYPVYR